MCYILLINVLKQTPDALAGENCGDADLGTSLRQFGRQNESHANTHTLIAAMNETRALKPKPVGVLRGTVCIARFRASKAVRKRGFACNTPMFRGWAMDIRALGWDFV